MKKQLKKFGILPIGEVLTKEQQKVITGGRDSDVCGWVCHTLSGGSVPFGQSTNGALQFAFENAAIVSYCQYC